MISNINIIYNGFWNRLPIIVGNRKDLKGIQQWIVEWKGNVYSNMFYKNKTTWKDNIDKSMSKIINFKNEL